jgi:hypothetical protein
MRAVFGAFLAAAGLIGPAAAEDKPAARFGVEADLKTYPQDSPKATLASVLKAADAKQFDYLDAQLADPTYIEDRVKRVYGGEFAEQVRDTHARLDPPTLKLLRRFLDDGEWTADETTATVRLKDVPERAVYFRNKDGRWYMEHRSKVKS